MITLLQSMLSWSAKLHREHSIQVWNWIRRCRFCESDHAVAWVDRSM